MRDILAANTADGTELLPELPDVPTQQYTIQANTLGNYCSKLGQVNVPLSPVLLFKIWCGHFSRTRRAKIRQAFTPFEGRMVQVHNFQPRNPKFSRAKVSFDTFFAI